MKLKSGGISRPFGNFVPGSLNSSKNVCAHACNGVILADGVYSRSLDTKIEEIIYLTMKVGYFSNRSKCIKGFTLVAFIYLNQLLQEMSEL